MFCSRTRGEEGQRRRLFSSSPTHRGSNVVVGAASHPCGPPSLLPWRLRPRLRPGPETPQAPLSLCQSSTLVPDVGNRGSRQRGSSVVVFGLCFFLRTPHPMAPPQGACGRSCAPVPKSRKPLSPSVIPDLIRDPGSLSFAFSSLRHPRPDLDLLGHSDKITPDSRTIR